MESDKRYFFEGLFILLFASAIVFAYIWLSRAGDPDDVTYRIHFSESVSGMALGDPVKYRGVDIGAVQSMALDPADPRRVEVVVRLRKDAPVKTDTKAILKMKGITGAVQIDLEGGTPKTQLLAAATPAGEIPEIPAGKSQLTTLLDELPRMAQKFSALESKTGKVLDDVGEVTQKIKENPSLLLRRPKEQPQAERNSRAP